MGRQVGQEQDLHSLLCLTPRAYVRQCGGRAYGIGLQQAVCPQGWLARMASCKVSRRTQMMLKGSPPPPIMEVEAFYMRRQAGRRAVGISLTVEVACPSFRAIPEPGLDSLPIVP